MERASKSRAAMVSGKGQVIHAARSIHATTKIQEKKYKLNAEKSKIPMDLPALANAGKGKETYVELDEPLAGSSTLITSDLLEESGHSSFSGTSHPPEPVDADMMTSIYAALDQGKPEIGRVVKGTSSKGPCFEDLSIQVQAVRPAAISSTSESLIMEPSGSGTTGGPSFITRNSRSTEISILPSDPGEKECVWDAFLPPSGNVSPHSSVDSTSVVTAMSIVNSFTSTYRSDGMTSDGMLSVERNCESMKGSTPGDSLESAKSSISRASDSSGLSSDENSWSHITGSANKPHKGNDPRWKAILAIRSRDGILGMSHFRLLKQLGCGDIGNVYLSELSGTRCYFAMKVMDKTSLASRKKLPRAQTERDVLQLLDHPFLPTLYTHFETD